MHVHIHPEMILVFRNHHHIFPKPVNDHARKAVIYQHLYRRFLSPEHSETLLGIIRHIQLLEVFSSLAGFIRHPDMQHLIHPVMLDQLRLCIISDHIIILIIPGQSTRADMIPCSSVTQFHLFLHIPLEILELDLLIFRNRIVDCIDSIIDAFIHRLNSSGYIHLSLQPLCIVFADQLFQLFYQCVGLLLCNEFGRLDGIYQKL